MATSDYTKSLIKKRNIFFILSTATWIGLGLTIAILCLSKVAGGGGEEILSASFKAKLASIGVTMLIGIVFSIILKERLRMTVYMFSLLVASVLSKTTGMYIVLAVWSVDEWIFRPIYLSLKNKVTINKEIDKR